MEASWDSRSIRRIAVDLNVVQVLATAHNSLWIESSEKESVGQNWNDSLERCLNRNQWRCLGAGLSVINSFPLFLFLQRQAKCLWCFQVCEETVNILRGAYSFDIRCIGFEWKCYWNSYQIVCLLVRRGSEEVISVRINDLSNFRKLRGVGGFL